VLHHEVGGGAADRGEHDEGVFAFDADLVDGPFGRFLSFVGGADEERFEDRGAVGADFFFQISDDLLKVDRFRHIHLNLRDRLIP